MHDEGRKEGKRKGRKIKLCNKHMYKRTKTDVIKETKVERKANAAAATHVGGP